MNLYRLMKLMHRHEGYEVKLNQSDMFLLRKRPFIVNMNISEHNLGKYLRARMTRLRELR
jgi:hypothetical protein